WDGGSWLRWALEDELEAQALGLKSKNSLPDVRPLSTERRAALAGTYDLPGGASFHLVDDGAHLWLAAEGPKALDKVAASPSGSTGDMESVNRKTQDFLGKLLQRDQAAIEAQLAHKAKPELKDYQAEWTEAQKKHGPLLGFRLLGSAPQGPTVRSF